MSRSYSFKQALNRKLLGAARFHLYDPAMLEADQELEQIARLEVVRSKAAAYIAKHPRPRAVFLGTAAWDLTAYDQHAAFSALHKFRAGANSLRAAWDRAASTHELALSMQQFGRIWRVGAQAAPTIDYVRPPMIQFSPYDLRAAFARGPE